MFSLKSILIFICIDIKLVLSDCPSAFFDCGNDRCIAFFWRCDGEDDCGNWADEQNCHTGPTEKPAKECPVDHVNCNDNHNTCIPTKWICDGMEDCVNAEDEKNCSKEKAHCDGFLCKSRECIPSRWRCDEIPDCDDHSDELNCTKPAVNHNCDKEHGFYKCLTGECIDHIKVCDRHKDCAQGDDEGIECQPNGCHVKSCSQLCFVAPHGPQCYCKEGYYIGSDNTTCIDHNECALSKSLGLCSQKCTNTDGGYKCSCDDDYELVDNKSCHIKDGEPVLLFSNSEGIRGLWLKTGRYFPIHNSIKRAVGIDMLVSEEKMFWVDLGDKESAIYSTDISGFDFKPVITTGLKSPEDLAIDWIGNNIYITDGHLNKIIVCHVDGTVCATLLSNLDLPRAIIVDPYQGLLYWTEWGKKSGIYQSGMDGSNPVGLIISNIHWPNGLALDFMTNRLYWSEAKSGSIEYYDFDLKKRNLVIKTNVYHPFSIAVFEDYVYWSDWMTYSLDKCNKFTGHNHTTILRELDESIMGVHVYHPITQKSSYNPCWFHTCSHLCLMAPSRRYSCTCPDNLQLDRDNKTCQSRSEASTLPSDGDIANIQLLATKALPVNSIPSTVSTTTTLPSTTTTTRAPTTRKTRRTTTTIRSTTTKSPSEFATKNSFKHKTTTKPKFIENEHLLNINENSFETEVETEGSDKSNLRLDGMSRRETNEHETGWVLILAIVLTIALICLIGFAIIRKDDYRDLRNTIFKRGQQARGAVVRFQRPLFRTQSSDDEELLNNENTEKY